ncbi:MAG: imidazolonepropionase, partial [Paracoccaceae bacterium]|nr:imidazolonepropionase [Paracoccaceae bacterium]
MLLTHATLATMTSDAGTEGYGLIPDAAVAIIGDRIAWTGPTAELPSKFRARPDHDCGGRLVTPGLNDCHT